MLGRDCPPRHGRKEGWSLDPLLPIDARPVDRPPVEPGRSAGLQPRHAEAKRSERAGKAERWRLPHATARASLQPGKELAAKEGAGGDDNGRGGQQPPVAQHHPGYRVAIGVRSEEHTSEIQSLMRTSYAVFFWKKK